MGGIKRGSLALCMTAVIWLAIPAFAVVHAFAASGQVYSCKLNYSVTAMSGKFIEWGSWGSLLKDGPGKKKAAAYGTIIIDTRPEATAPVRMFGEPSAFDWKVTQKAGRGNGWTLFGKVYDLQGRGSRWSQIISVKDYEWPDGKSGATTPTVPITYFDMNTLYTGLCKRV